MKYLSYNFFVLVIVMLGFCNVKAQSSTNFEFQVQALEGNKFSFTMRIPNPEHVQFIEIGFLDNPGDNFALEIFTASLNKKRDNAYYFSMGSNEYKVAPSEFLFQIERQINTVANSLKQKGVYVKLLDINFKELVTYQQVIID